MRHSELKAKNPDPDLSCPRRRASPMKTTPTLASRGVFFVGCLTTLPSPN